MKWLLEKILYIVSWFIMFIIVVLIMMSIPITKHHYEYIDIDNNEGIAKECSYKFTGYKKGGQGSPVCELYDGTIIQVKQYKYIKDSECVPLKDENLCN